MSDADEEAELLSRIDWTPYSDVDHWVERCESDEGVLSNLLGLTWIQIEWLQEDLLQGEPVKCDVDLLFSLSDIVTRWSSHNNNTGLLAISPLAFPELAFTVKRLFGTVPTSLSVELALNSIDRLRGLLRFLQANFCPQEPPPVITPQKIQEGGKTHSRRSHGAWASTSPPNGDEWRQQRGFPIEGTQPQVLEAMDIDRKTLRNMAGDGRIYAMLIGKTSSRENLLQIWILDPRRHFDVYSTMKQMNNPRYSERD